MFVVLTDYEPRRLKLAMGFPSLTLRGRILGLVVIGLWALLFLPGLRTNPNWYGDEGEVMEMGWTLAHGQPRVGPVVNDFLYPPPYPPVYLVVMGGALRVFGHDIVVARALGAVAALAAAGILYWIGCRLRLWLLGYLECNRSLGRGDIATATWIGGHKIPFLRGKR